MNKVWFMNELALREDIYELAANQYGTEPDFPWMSLPDYAVLRHLNGKWYGVIMNIPKNRLGIDSDECVDILVCKCDSIMREILLSEKGFYPAYHMNKQHWITMLLDGSVESSSVLETSYNLIK